PRRWSSQSPPRVVADHDEQRTNPKAGDQARVAAGDESTPNGRARRWRGSGWGGQPKRGRPPAGRPCSARVTPDRPSRDDATGGERGLAPAPPRAFGTDQGRVHLRLLCVVHTRPIAKAWPSPPQGCGSPPLLSGLGCRPQVRFEGRVPGEERGRIRVGDGGGD